MPVLTRFIRNTPGPGLKSYFEARGVPLPEPVNWNGGTSAIVPPLLRAVDALGEPERERLRADAERVDAMAGEVGQTAILAVASAGQWETLRDIETPHFRALWLFLNDPERFHHAEHASFFDNARRGRTWDGFIARPGLSVSRDPAHLRALADDVQAFFREGRKVKVEVFDRTRPDAEGLAHQLIQVTVYREGLPSGQTVFQGDELDLGLLVFRPVCELAFTYEPTSGVIEVVAERKPKRADLARLFAAALLDHRIEGRRIPLRRCDLSIFMEERDFPTDPQDNILDVRPRLVQFETLDGRAYVTIEARSDEETVRDVARGMFGERSPFIAGGYRIREVVLAVVFGPDRANPRGKTVAIKLRDPNGCDLKDKTEKERKLGEKYLKRWGILVGVRDA